MKKMEQRNCLPYFVNTPPPNIRKQKEYNPVTGQSDGSNAKPPAQTRYTVENNNRKPSERSEQQNYLNSRLKRDSRQQYEMASRAPNLSSNIDFSRPPPINQSPNQKYQSDCPRPPEVTKLPRMKSECSGKIQETLLNRTPEQNGIVRPPLSIVSQQSSGHQPSGSLRPPHPPNAHRFWPTQITDMFSVKRKPTVRTTPAARAQPPIPAGPPPSSPPPPPPGPPTAGPTLEVKRQLLTPPSMMPQLQTTSRGGDQQLSVMPRLPLEVKQQSQTPPFDVKQQIQTPPPRFVTPPSQPTYYAQAPPFFLAIGSYTDGGLFKVPPPMIRTRGGVPGTVFQGPPAKTTYYIQESTYVNPPNSGYNHYKRSRVSDSLDPELRRGSKKKKKSLALILPQRKGWSVEDAKKAIDIEKECSKGTRKYSLFIKFPDPELNREIVSSFHSAIESVHFQQPSTPRFCFVNISSSADPEAVRQELNKVQFGGGYLSAEFKKDREDDYNINPEDIDPTTLYVGNLAQEVTKDDMLRMYPTSKRIDIGYAKKMKFTRYAFVAFKNAVDAIEAYKKTHDTQMYNKSLIVRFRRMNGTIGMLGEPKVQSKTDKDRSQSKSSETNGQMPSEENENETVDNNPWNIDVSTWEESYDDMYDDDCMLDVKPSLEDLEKDVKVPRDIDQFLLRDNLEDFFSPNILDEAKREITSEDATRRDTFSDSHNKTSIRLQEDHNDIHPSPNTSEVDNSELDNPVKVKDEIKSEVDQTRDDKSLRSTYRQLMLTRRKKNLAIKVEEDSNAIKTEAGRSETSNLEKERVDDLFGVNASKSDRETNQEHLKDSISIADDDRGPQENIEEIEKKVKEETPHSLTNRCISTYGELKEFGMKMQITRKVMVKEEIESVGCDLQDDQLHAVDVQEADTDLSLDTGITGQAQGGQNVQSSELSRNEDNLTNTMTSSQTNNAHGSTLEFDSCTEVNARQNQAAEQENGEFNFDVDLNSLLTDVKKEPRVEDYENYDELDEEEDDDIENFLKRRKAQI